MNLSENQLLQNPDFSGNLGRPYVKKNPLSPNYFKTTYQTQEVCSNILRPTTHDDLVQLINNLNSKGLSFHVVSTGLNLGYGGKVPEYSCDVLIDLILLKNMEVDANRAVATVECGVTQLELFNYLKKKELDYYFHITGAPADSSIVGNAMAGGYANGINSIRYDRVLSVKGVYRDGTEFNTLNGSNTKYTDKADIRGLFKGGEQGIITEIEYELDPIPEYMHITFFSVDENEEIGEVMDTFEYFRKHGVIQSNVSIFNSYRIYAENAGHYTPTIGIDPQEFKKRIYKYLEDNGLDFWCGEYNGVIANNYTNMDVMSITENYIETTLRKHLTKYKTIVVTKEDIKRLRYDTTAALPKDALEGMRGRILTFTGTPKYGSMSMSYWRKKSVDLNAMNIEKDKCGFLWLALSLVPESKNCLETVKALEKVVFKYNFEPFYVIDYVRPHETYIMWAIIYNRNNKDEDQKAIECYRECVDYINTNDKVTVYRKPKNLKTN
ncbi:MAG: FAD-binding oxidoreductase [Bacteroidia bacterium]